MMIEVIDDYFKKGCGRCDRFATADCSTRRFEEGLAELRRICLESGLEEKVKWGHPCYVHAGRNIVIFGAHRESFQLGFFHPALMKDPEGILSKQGPNTPHPDVVRFTDNAQVAKREPILRAYLAEAMSYAEAGMKPPKVEREIELPQELADALADDFELAEAFNNLTPGRQRSYVIHLNSAKKSETRIARIVKARDKILAGKGANER